MALMTSAFDEAAADARLTYQEKVDAKESFQRGIGIGLILVILLVVFIKAVFYSVIMVYLVQPHIRQLFGEVPTDEINSQLPPETAAPTAAG